LFCSIYLFFPIPWFAFITLFIECVSCLSAPHRQITRDIFRKKDEEGRYVVDYILDKAGQKGTGKWTCINGLELGSPVTLVRRVAVGSLVVVVCRCLFVVYVSWLVGWLVGWFVLFVLFVLFGLLCRFVMFV
jgi:hypothetical protein